MCAYSCLPCFDQTGIVYIHVQAWHWCVKNGLTAPWRLLVGFPLPVSSSTNLTDFF